jgi:hypothetical protein
MKRNVHVIRGSQMWIGIMLVKRTPDTWNYASRPLSVRSNLHPNEATEKNRNRPLCMGIILVWRASSDPGSVLQ